MSRVVVLAGGSPHAHDFDAIGLALTELVESEGHAVELVRDPDDAAERVGHAGHDVAAMVVDGLWWRMLDEVYAPWRSAFAYSPSPSTRAAFVDFVGRGGGLVALHTTPICFDDWPEWGDVVGGSWRWGVSSHPPLGSVRARVVADHPVVTGIGPEIILVDEVYGGLDVRDTVEVLAIAKRDSADADQPVVWAHRFGHGRVVFDGFGHDATSIRHDQHGRLIRQALAWVLEAA